MVFIHDPDNLTWDCVFGNLDKIVLYDSMKRNLFAQWIDEKRKHIHEM